jgi:hypothetical protein
MFATQTTYDVQRNNWLPQCAELEISEGQGTDRSTVVLLAELRCGSGRVCSDKHTAKVQITGGELRLAIEGGRIRANSRLGEFDRPATETAELEIKTSQISEASAEAGAKLSASLSKPSLSASLAALGTSSIKEEKSSKRQETDARFRVRAKGGNTWDIQEIDGKSPLEGRYIGYEELCVIEGTSEVTKIRAELLVPKRAILISEVTDNASGAPKRLTMLKKKLLNVIAAKSIRQDGDAVVICESIMSPKTTQ